MEPRRSNNPKGLFTNQELVGEALKPYRDRVGAANIELTQDELKSIDEALAQITVGQRQTIPDVTVE
ncbi:hypothetical protein [Nostoc sp. ChiSLP03a]|uniref:hypothetical protein n=1 Tax=Nostoc sp. ChiSLP03a TaxID=3075380 RepID=UPI002AD43779|nr:hypothetical protein [Nostoc sp. ChiSLP03a]MDZ8211253.1 hypothetical protein [Nostoc sp. ChiSLP03a]